MGYSNNCVELVKRFEGLKLSSYLCLAGKLTIGYGHTGPDVKDNQTITADQATDMLRRDLIIANVLVRSLVKVSMTQGQEDALTSFVFNLGGGNLKTSTLLTKMNNGDAQGASEEFPRWCHAGGKTLSGLVQRRLAEQVLFTS